MQRDGKETCEPERMFNIYSRSVAANWADQGGTQLCAKLADGTERWEGGRKGREAEGRRA